MKTLSQLWQEGGGKPIKVRRKGWETSYWFMCMGQAPDGSFYGYSQGGAADFWPTEDATWSLYVEPAKEKLVPHWPAVMFNDVLNTYLLSDALYPKTDKNPEIRTSRFVRLATEYPALMLPEVES